MPSPELQNAINSFDYRAYLKLNGYTDEQIPESLDEATKQKLFSIAYSEHFDNLVKERQLSTPGGLTPSAAKDEVEQEELETKPYLRPLFGLWEKELSAEELYKPEMLFPLLKEEGIDVSDPYFDPEALSEEQSRKKLEPILDRYVEQIINKKTPKNAPELKGVGKDEFKQQFLQRQGLFAEDDIGSFLKVYKKNADTEAIQQDVDERGTLGWLGDLLPVAANQGMDMLVSSIPSFVQQRLQGTRIPGTNIQLSDPLQQTVGEGTSWFANTLLDLSTWARRKSNELVKEREKMNFKPRYGGMFEDYWNRGEWGNMAGALTEQLVLNGSSTLQNIVTPLFIAFGNRVVTPIFAAGGMAIGGVLGGPVGAAAGLATGTRLGNVATGLVAGGMMGLGSLMTASDTIADLHELGIYDDAQVNKYLEHIWTAVALDSMSTLTEAAMIGGGKLIGPLGKNRQAIMAQRRANLAAARANGLDPATVNKLAGLQLLRNRGLMNEANRRIWQRMATGDGAWRVMRRTAGGMTIEGLQERQQEAINMDLVNMMTSANQEGMIEAGFTGWINPFFTDLPHREGGYRFPDKLVRHRLTIAGLTGAIMGGVTTSFGTGIQEFAKARQKVKEAKDGEYLTVTDKDGKTLIMRQLAAQRMRAKGIFQQMQAEGNGINAQTIIGVGLNQVEGNSFASFNGVTGVGKSANDAFIDLTMKANANRRNIDLGTLTAVTDGHEVTLHNGEKVTVKGTNSEQTLRDLVNLHNSDNHPIVLRGGMTIEYDGSSARPYTITHANGTKVRTQSLYDNYALYNFGSNIDPNLVFDSILRRTGAPDVETNIGINITQTGTFDFKSSEQAIRDSINNSNGRLVLLDSTVSRKGTKQRTRANGNLQADTMKVADLEQGVIYDIKLKRGKNNSNAHVNVTARDFGGKTLRLDADIAKQTIRDAANPNALKNQIKLKTRAKEGITIQGEQVAGQNIWHFKDEQLAEISRLTGAALVRKEANLVEFALPGYRRKADGTMEEFGVIFALSLDENGKVTAHANGQDIAIEGINEYDSLVPGETNLYAHALQGGRFSTVGIDQNTGAITLRRTTAGGEDIEIVLGRRGTIDSYRVVSDNSARAQGMVDQAVNARNAQTAAQQQAQQQMGRIVDPDLQQFTPSEISHMGLDPVTIHDRIKNIFSGEVFSEIQTMGTSFQRVRDILTNRFGYPADRFLVHQLVNEAGATNQWALIDKNGNVVSVFDNTTQGFRDFKQMFDVDTMNDLLAIDDIEPYLMEQLAKNPIRPVMFFTDAEYQAAVKKFFDYHDAVFRPRPDTQNMMRSGERRAAITKSYRIHFDDVYYKRVVLPDIASIRALYGRALEEGYGLWDPINKEFQKDANGNTYFGDRAYINSLRRNPQGALISAYAAMNPQPLFKLGNNHYSENEIVSAANQTSNLDLITEDIINDIIDGRIQGYRELPSERVLRGERRYIDILNEKIHTEVRRLLDPKYNDINEIAAYYGSNFVRKKTWRRMMNGEYVYLGTDGKFYTEMEVNSFNDIRNLVEWDWNQYPHPSQTMMAANAYSEIYIVTNDNGVTMLRQEAALRDRRGRVRPRADYDRDINRMVQRLRTADILMLKHDTYDVNDQINDQIIDEDQETPVPPPDRGKIETDIRQELEQAAMNAQSIEEFFDIYGAQVQQRYVVHDSATNLNVGRNGNTVDVGVDSFLTEAEVADYVKQHGFASTQEVIPYYVFFTGGNTAIESFAPVVYESSFMDELRRPEKVAAIDISRRVDERFHAEEARVGAQNQRREALRKQRAAVASGAANQSSIQGTPSQNPLGNSPHLAYADYLTRLFGKDSFVSLGARVELWEGGISMANVMTNNTDLIYRDQNLGQGQRDINNPEHSLDRELDSEVGSLWRSAKAKGLVRVHKTIADYFAAKPHVLQGLLEEYQLGKIARETKRAKNAIPPLDVWTAVAMMTQADIDQAVSTLGIQGYYDENEKTIHLIEEMIPRGNAANVFYHELAVHATMHLKYGNVAKQWMDIIRYLKAHQNDDTQLGKAIQRIIRNRKAELKLHPRDSNAYWEEIAAYLVEDFYGRLSFAERISAFFRSIFHSTGIVKQGEEITIADIVRFAKAKAKVTVSMSKKLSTSNQGYSNAHAPFFSMLGSAFHVDERTAQDQFESIDQYYSQVQYSDYFGMVYDRTTGILNESNLDREHWVLARTPMFKKWFGDWENRPYSASKIVDTNGEPLVIYHNPKYDYDAYDEPFIGLNGNFGHSGKFIYDSLLENPYAEKLLGGRVAQSFINIRKPLHAHNYERMRQYMESLGYEQSSKRLNLDKLAASVRSNPSMRVIIEGIADYVADTEPTTSFADFMILNDNAIFAGVSLTTMRESHQFLNGLFEAATTPRDSILVNEPVLNASTLEEWYNNLESEEERQEWQSAVDTFERNLTPFENHMLRLSYNPDGYFTHLSRGHEDLTLSTREVIKDVMGAIDARYHAYGERDIIEFREAVQRTYDEIGNEGLFLDIFNMALHQARREELIFRLGEDLDVVTTPAYPVPTAQALLKEGNRELARDLKTAMMRDGYDGLLGSDDILMFHPDQAHDAAEFKRSFPARNIRPTQGIRTNPREQRVMEAIDGNITRDAKVLGVTPVRLRSEFREIYHALGDDLQPVQQRFQDKESEIIAQYGDSERQISLDDLGFVSGYFSRLTRADGLLYNIQAKYGNDVIEPQEYTKKGNIRKVSLSERIRRAESIEEVRRFLAPFVNAWRERVFTVQISIPDDLIRNQIVQVTLTSPRTMQQIARSAGVDYQEDPQNYSDADVRQLRTPIEKEIMRQREDILKNWKDGLDRLTSKMKQSGAQETTEYTYLVWRSLYHHYNENRGTSLPVEFVEDAVESVLVNGLRYNPTEDFYTQYVERIIQDVADKSTSTVEIRNQNGESVGRWLRVAKGSESPDSVNMAISRCRAASFNTGWCTRSTGANHVIETDDHDFWVLYSDRRKSAVMALVPIKAKESEDTLRDNKWYTGIFNLDNPSDNSVPVDLREDVKTLYNETNDQDVKRTLDLLRDNWLTREEIEAVKRENYERLKTSLRNSALITEDIYDLFEELTGIHLTIENLHGESGYSISNIDSNTFNHIEDVELRALVKEAVFNSILTVKYSINLDADDNNVNFPRLKRVGSSIFVEDNANFPNLQEVPKHLFAGNNFYAPNLVIVLGDFRVRSNPVLPALLFVSGKVNVDYDNMQNFNENFVKEYFVPQELRNIIYINQYNIDIFNNATGTNLYINENEEVTIDQLSTDDLSRLYPGLNTATTRMLYNGIQHINGDAILKYGDFSNLISISGNAIIEGRATSVPNLRYIDGNLDIADFSSNFIRNLRTVGGNLKIDTTDSSMSSSYNIEAVGGDLILTGNEHGLKAEALLYLGGKIVKQGNSDLRTNKNLQTELGAERALQAWRYDSSLNPDGLRGYGDTGSYALYFSILDPYSRILVRTPSFKENFGDWQNDPNPEMVLDEHGEPLRFPDGFHYGTGIVNLDEPPPYFSRLGRQGAARLLGTPNYELEAQAEMLEAMGKDANTILLATGYRRDNDGHWRYEVSNIEHNLKGQFTENDHRFNYEDEFLLSDVFDAPELYKAYPGLLNTRVIIVEGFSEKDATFSPEENIIEIGVHRSGRIDRPEVLRDTLLHEVQHYIQEEEGLPGGTNVDLIAYNLSNTPEYKQILRYQNIINGADTPEEFERYRREYIPEINQLFEKLTGLKGIESFEEIYNASMGEVEADAVGRRANLTQEELLRRPFETDMRVAPENQVDTDLFSPLGYFSILGPRDNASLSSAENALPQGQQKQANVQYPDFTEEQITLYFSLSKKNREEAIREMQRPREGRPDLSETQMNLILDELDKYDQPKMQKLMLKWMLNGSIAIPISGREHPEAYQVKEAMELAAKVKVDPFQFNSPVDILNRYKELRPDSIPITPESVPELDLDSRIDHGDGIVSYQVQDNEAGQKAVRRIINSHWGKNWSNWCLTRANTQGQLQQPEAWDMWSKYYNGLPKRVAFKNGKIISLMATQDSNGYYIDTTIDDLNQLMRDDVLDKMRYGTNQDVVAIQQEYNLTTDDINLIRDYSTLSDQLGLMETIENVFQQYFSGNNSIFNNRRLTRILLFIKNEIIDNKSGLNILQNTAISNEIREILSNFNIPSDQLDFATLEKRANEYVSLIGFDREEIRKKWKILIRQVQQDLLDRHTEMIDRVHDLDIYQSREVADGVLEIVDRNGNLADLAEVGLYGVENRFYWNEKEDTHLTRISEKWWDQNNKEHSNLDWARDVSEGYRRRRSAIDLNTTLGYFSMRGMGEAFSNYDDDFYDRTEIVGSGGAYRLKNGKIFVDADEVGRENVPRITLYALIRENPDVLNNAKIADIVSKIRAWENSNDPRERAFSAEIRVLMAQNNVPDSAILAYAVRKMMSDGIDPSNPPNQTSPEGVFAAILSEFPALIGQAASVSTSMVTMSAADLVTTANALAGVENVPIDVALPGTTFTDQTLDQFQPEVTSSPFMNAVMNEVQELIANYDNAHFDTIDGRPHLVLGSQNGFVLDLTLNPLYIRNVIDQFINHTTDFGNFDTTDPNSTDDEQKGKPGNPFTHIMEKMGTNAQLNNRASQADVERFINTNLPAYIADRIQVVYNETSEFTTLFNDNEYGGVYRPVTADRKVIYIRAYDRNLSDVIGSIVHLTSNFGWTMWNNADFVPLMDELWTVLKHNIQTDIPTYYERLQGKPPTSSQKAALISAYLATKSRSIYDLAEFSRSPHIPSSEQQHMLDIAAKVKDQITQVELNIAKSFAQDFANNEELVKEYSEKLLRMTMAPFYGKGMWFAYDVDYDNLKANNPNISDKYAGWGHVMVFANDFGQVYKPIPISDDALTNQLMLQDYRRTKPFWKDVKRTIWRNWHPPMKNVGDTIIGLENTILLTRVWRAVTTEWGSALENVYSRVSSFDDKLIKRGIDTENFDRAKGYVQELQDRGITDKKLLDDAEIIDTFLRYGRQKMLQNVSDIRRLITYSAQRAEYWMRHENVPERDIMKMHREMDRYAQRFVSDWEHRSYRAFSREDQDNLQEMWNILDGYSKPPTRNDWFSNTARDAQRDLAKLEQDRSKRLISESDYAKRRRELRNTIRMYERLDALYHWTNQNVMARLPKRTSSKYRQELAAVPQRVNTEMKTEIENIMTQVKNVGERGLLGKMDLIPAFRKRKLNENIPHDRLYMTFLDQVKNPAMGMLYNLDQQGKILDKLNFNLRFGESILQNGMGTMKGSRDHVNLGVDNLSWMESGSFLQYVKVDPFFLDEIRNEQEIQLNVREHFFGGLVNMLKQNFTVLNLRMLVSNYIGNVSNMIATGQLFRWGHLKAGIIGINDRKLRSLLETNMEKSVKRLGSRENVVAAIKDYNSIVEEYTREMERLNIWGSGTTSTDMSFYGNSGWEKIADYTAAVAEAIGVIDDTTHKSINRLVGEKLKIARELYGYGDEWVKPLTYMNNRAVTMAKYRAQENWGRYEGREDSVEARLLDERIRDMASREAAILTMKETTTWELAPDLVRKLAAQKIRVVTPDFLLHGFQMARIMTVNVGRTFECAGEVARLMAKGKENLTEDERIYLKLVGGELVRRTIGQTLMTTAMWNMAHWAGSLGMYMVGSIIAALRGAGDEDDEERKRRRGRARREDSSFAVSPSEYTALSMLCNAVSMVSDLYAPLMWVEGKVGKEFYAINWQRINAAYTFGTVRPATVNPTFLDRAKHVLLELADLRSDPLSVQIADIIRGKNRYGQDITGREQILEGLSLITPQGLHQANNIALGMKQLMLGTEDMSWEDRRRNYPLSVYDLTGIKVRKYSVLDMIENTGRQVNKLQQQYGNAYKRNFFKTLENNLDMTDQDIANAVSTIVDNNTYQMDRIRYSMEAFRLLGIDRKTLEERLSVSRNGNHKIMGQNEIGLLLAGRDVLTANVITNLKSKIKELQDFQSDTNIPTGERRRVLENYQRAYRKLVEAMR